MNIEKEVFSGKKVSDILQEIYDRQKQQDLTVKEQIDLLASYIAGPGDAIAIIPHIKDLMDTGVKNTEVLLKIVQLFKQNQESSSESSSGILSEKDIQQLFDDVTHITANSSVKTIGN